MSPTQPDGDRAARHLRPLPNLASVLARQTPIYWKIPADFEGQHICKEKRVPFSHSVTLAGLNAAGTPQPLVASTT